MAAMTPEEGVRAVADATVRGTDPARTDWNWGPGVLMTGMMAAHALTGEDRYREFVREWADGHLRALGDRLARNDDYCGYWGPGLPVLRLYEATGEERYGEGARAVIEYLLANGARLDNGAFGHNSGEYARQMWVDTAYMAVPLLSDGARIFGEPEFRGEAVRQLNAFSAHAQDPRSGLFSHCYDEAGDGANGVHWGRGNGWMAMAYAGALAGADSGWGTRGLIHQFGRLLQGLMARRDGGRWHTVVDDPDTYPETSATAMVLFGLAEVRRRDLFTVPYDPGPAWDALAEQVTDEGAVTGVSGGTAPAASAAEYDAVPRGTYTWGTGAFLLAASAYADIA